jgi:very-short-patch-repair endonuclease
MNSRPSDSTNRKFRRQAQIGNYIVDFVCFASKIVVELDGGQHASQIDRDEIRAAWLNSQGYRVLRFWNFQVFEEPESVLETIWLALRDAPSPQPSPTTGEGASEDDPSNA